VGIGDKIEEVIWDVNETIEPILVASDLDKRMRMEVDISDYATEGVLSMKCTDGK